MQVNVVVLTVSEMTGQDAVILSHLMDVPEDTNLDEYTKTVQAEFKKKVFNQFPENLRVNNPTFVSDDNFLVIG